MNLTLTLAMLLAAMPNHSSPDHDPEDIEHFDAEELDYIGSAGLTRLSQMPAAEAIPMLELRLKRLTVELGRAIDMDQLDSVAEIRAEIQETKVRLQEHRTQQEARN